jgi:benzoate membrane transport protein
MSDGVVAEAAEATEAAEAAEAAGASGAPAAPQGSGTPGARPGPGSLAPAFVAGLVTAVVGFASSFPLVIAGLRAVGATQAQAASGLLVLSLLMGAACIVFSLRHRIPITIAWSTPGAALLIGVGHSHGRYALTLGAFAVAGALTVLTAASKTLTRWIAAVPAPVSAAMLAGVLLPICLAPVQAAVQVPRLALPAIAVWVVLGRFARRWAVPAALAVALLGILLDPGTRGHVSGGLKPELVFTAPAFGLGSVVGVAIPLYLVTMAAQNLTGITVLRSFGYEPPVREVLAGTGAATVAGAPFGGIAVNFAAISAALAAGPDAHRDPARRWVASTTAGVLYLVFGLTAAAATSLLVAAPPVLIEGVAGLALLGALGGALTSALADAPRREAALATFAVTASGVTVAGIGSPFWGLLTGLVLLGIGWQPSASKR